MSSVYSHSPLNIAASSAKNGSQGCFLKQKNFSEDFYAECISGGKILLLIFHEDESVYHDATDGSHL